VQVYMCEASRANILVRGFSSKYIYARLFEESRLVQGLLRASICVRGFSSAQVYLCEAF